MTSPDRFPENEIAELEEVAFPAKLAFTTLAEKFPLESRTTIRLATLFDVAELAAEAPEATVDAESPPTCETTVADCVPVTSPNMLPVKLTAEFAFVAVPIRLAVTTLAEKLPLESRTTILFAVLPEVAEFAAFEPDATEAAESPPTDATTVAD